MRLKGGKNYVKTDFKVRTYGNIIIKCVIPKNVHTPSPPQRATEIQKGGGSVRWQFLRGWGWQGISYFTLNRCSKAKIFFFHQWFFICGWLSAFPLLAQFYITTAVGSWIKVWLSMGSFVAQYIAVFNIMRSCCIKLSPNTFLTKKK